MDQQTLERIVAEVVQRVTKAPVVAPHLASSGARPGVFTDLDSAVRAAAPEAAKGCAPKLLSHARHARDANV